MQDIPHTLREITEHWDTIDEAQDPHQSTLTVHPEGQCRVQSKSRQVTTKEWLRVVAALVVIRERETTLS